MTSLAIREKLLVRATRGKRTLTDYHCGRCGIALDKRAAVNAACHGCPMCGSVDIDVSVVVLP